MNKINPKNSDAHTAYARRQISLDYGQADAAEISRRQRLFLSRRYGLGSDRAAVVANLAFAGGRL